MVHGKFHCKLSACKQAVQNYMPVSDREEKMEVDSNFKHWITKERQFSLQDLPGLGLNFTHSYSVQLIWQILTEFTLTTSVHSLEL